MKTFKQFLEESEERIKEPKPVRFNKKTTKVIQARSKKIARKVAKDIERQKKENPNKPPVANFNQRDKKTGQEIYSAPASPERQAEIEAMLALTRKWKKSL